MLTWYFKLYNHMKYENSGFIVPKFCTKFLNLDYNYFVLILFFGTRSLKLLIIVINSFFPVYLHLFSLYTYILVEVLRFWFRPHTVGFADCVPISRGHDIPTLIVTQDLWRMLFKVSGSPKIGSIDSPVHHNLYK